MTLNEFLQDNTALIQELGENEAKQLLDEAACRLKNSNTTQETLVRE